MIPTRSGSKPVRPGVGERLARRADRDRHAALELARLLGRDDRGRVEVLDLARDPHREVARVERLDEVDAALARQRRAPGRGRVEAERRDRPEAGYRNATRSHTHRASLVIGFGACPTRASRIPRSRSRPMEAELVRELPAGRRLVVRAEVGRLPRRARERRRRAAAVVAQRAAAAALLPRAAAARRAAAAAVGARRRDRDRARGRARLRRDADAPASGRVARRASCRPRSRPSSSRSTCCSGTASRCGSGRSRSGAGDLERVGKRLPPLAAHERPGRGARLARPLRGARPRRRRREERRRCRTCPARATASSRSRRTRPRTASSSASASRRARRTRSRRCCSASSATTARSTTSARARSRRRGAPRWRSACCRCSSASKTEYFSEPSRWGTGDLEQAWVRKELVVEVRYDKVQGNRFRHGTKWLRWRDDKDPARLHLARAAPAARPERGRRRVAPRLAARAEHDRRRRGTRRRRSRRATSRARRPGRGRARRRTRRGSRRSRRCPRAPSPWRSICRKRSSRPSPRRPRIVSLRLPPSRISAPKPAMIASETSPAPGWPRDPLRREEHEPERDREQGLEPLRPSHLHRTSPPLWHRRNGRAPARAAATACTCPSRSS